MSAFVYVLISSIDQNRYIGSTDDLERRLKEHQKGYVFATRKRRPLELAYVQTLSSLGEARVLESKYKKSRGLFDKAVKSGLLRRVA